MTKEANEILNKILECIHMQRKEPEYKDNWGFLKKIEKNNLNMQLKKEFKETLPMSLVFFMPLLFLMSLQDLIDPINSLQNLTNSIDE